MSAADVQAAKAMEDFVSRLVRCAVVSGGALPESVSFDQTTGLLSLKVKSSSSSSSSSSSATTQDRVMCPAALFPQYEAARDKDAFISTAVMTYVMGAAKMPASWAEAAPLLRPRVQTASYFADKAAALPAGAELPWSAVARDGSLGVYVVADFGFAVVPVLSTDLERWQSALGGGNGGGGGGGFEEVLAVAVAALRASSTAGSGNKWKGHPSGCYESSSSHGHEAACAALLPEGLLLGGEAGITVGRMMTGDAKADAAAAKDAADMGDIVASFASHRKVRSGAQGPQACVHMGAWKEWTGLPAPLFR